MKRKDLAENKRQICAVLDAEIVEEMEKLREELGIPVSQQISLRLKGYRIVKIRED